MQPVELKSEPLERQSAAPLRESAAWFGIAALSLFFLATSLYISAHRLFWFDELFTVMYAGLPNWRLVSDALAHADNQTPVSYYLLMFPVDRFFGNIHIAARLPSALAMTAGLIIIFDCVRRLTDGLGGLIAVAFLTCSFLPYYGYEARSYGIYFMLGALSLWLWLHTRADRKVPAALFGLTLLVAMLVQYYAVLLIVPYALWEALRWRPWQRPSLKLIAGAVGLGAAVLLLLGQIRGAAGHNATFWAKPSPYALQQAYSEFFPSGLFLLALVIVWIVVARTDGASRTVLPMAPPEHVGWLFLTIPLAGFVVAELVTKAFVPRYFIGLLPGTALAFSSMLWRYFSKDQRVRLGIVALLASFGVYEQLQTVRNPELADPYHLQSQTHQILGMEAGLHKDGKQYILCANSMLFLDAFYYSRTPDQYAFVVVSPEQSETGTTRLLAALARYYPLHLWTIEDLRKHARESALVEPRADLLDAIRKAGIRTIIQGDRPLQTVYFEE
ncbi:MAG TPA: glycosyltransferase family 39 protein [Bryobacteraceae bacterium]